MCAHKCSPNPVVIFSIPQRGHPPLKGLHSFNGYKIIVYFHSSDRSSVIFLLLLYTPLWRLYPYPSFNPFGVV
nr:MAG TPA: hypothetical protein [Bacteriophage sp.]